MCGGDAAFFQITLTTCLFFQGIPFPQFHEIYKEILIMTAYRPRKHIVLLDVDLLTDRVSNMLIKLRRTVTECE